MFSMVTAVAAAYAAATNVLRTTENARRQKVEGGQAGSQQSKYSCSAEVCRVANTKANLYKAACETLANAIRIIKSCQNDMDQHRQDSAG
jgi:hypothetical protein